MSLADLQGGENWNDWRWQVAQGACRHYGVPEVDANVCARYPFSVTPYYASLVESWCDTDPIALQCMPLPAELSGYEAGDPLGEIEHVAAPGLIHRYRDRAVFLVSGDCAVRCRHCTRKNSLEAIKPAISQSDRDSALKYVSECPEIREIIVSGGDPLMMGDRELEAVLERVKAIQSVKVIRIGSRMPVTAPMRVSGPLCRILARYRPLWFNTHFNHPRELTEESLGACSRIIEAGIPVSNQCVLLKGVNDDAEVLMELCNRLQEASVRPYYVFLCDPVNGTGHFRVPREQALEIERELRRKLGGLSMPLFVQDVPGKDGKRPLCCSG